MMFLLGLSEETTLVNVISSLADGAAPVGRSDGYSFICGSSLGAAPGVYSCTKTPPPQTSSQ